MLRASILQGTGLRSERNLDPPLSEHPAALIKLLKTVPLCLSMFIQPTRHLVCICLCALRLAMRKRQPNGALQWHVMGRPPEVHPEWAF